MSPSYRPPRRRVSFRLPPSSLAALRDLERATGAPRSALLEIALRMLLARRDWVDLLADAQGSARMGGERRSAPVSAVLTLAVLDRAESIASRLATTLTDLVQGAIYGMRWSSLWQLDLGSGPSERDPPAAAKDIL